MTFSLKKKYYTVRIFQSLSRNLVYAFNEDHSGVKKKTKSNACMKIFDLPKILQDQHFFSCVLYPASWMSPILYVHSYSAYFKSYGYSKPSKDMFFPLGYAMIL